MFKAYIASPFFNNDELNTVIEIENQLSNNKINFFSPRSEGTLVKMTPKEREIKFKEIYQSNILNMDQSSIMIANIDNYDPGTIYEIGWFSKSSKPIFTFSNNDFGLNVMLRQSVLCHNTKYNNLMINIREYLDNKRLTKFDELTKNVT